MGQTTKMSSQRAQKEDLLARAIIQLARWLQLEPSLLPIAMSHSIRIAFHVFGVEQSRLPPVGPSGSTSFLSAHPTFLLRLCSVGDFFRASKSKL